MAVLAAIGVREDGHREILGADEGMSEAQGELGRVPSRLEGAWAQGSAPCDRRQMPWPSGGGAGGVA